MQILLNTDPHVDGRHQMADHLSEVVNDALSRFKDQVTRVEAHLADLNGQAKTHPDEIHCTLEARLVGKDPVVVKAHADNAHQAIQSAVGKLKRAITSALEKHESRHSDGLPPAPEADEPADPRG